MDLFSNEIVFLIECGVSAIYYINAVFMVSKLRGMEKDAIYYQFIKSLAYFFFFYGTGALWFVYYDFFVINMAPTNPFGPFAASFPLETLNLWKVGILLQNIGLVLMLNQLKERVFKKSVQRFAMVYEACTITIIIFMTDLFWAELMFLMSFLWSLSLPLTYSYIYKHSAGKFRRYAAILWVNIIVYGIWWGFRSLIMIEFFYFIFGVIVNIFAPIQVTYNFAIWLRGIFIIEALTFVLYGYKKLLSTF